LLTQFFSLLLWWRWQPSLGLPLITDIIAVILPCCGSFLGGILWLLCISLGWLDDISMMSSALLNDIGHTSFGSLAIIVGVALIRLGGVNFVFLTVSPKLISTFLVLPNPTPYSDSESLSLYWRFLDFLLIFFRDLLSLSNFLLNWAERSAFRDWVLICLSWQHGNWLSPFCLSHTYNNPWYCA
jgi:hypothetical protein